MPPSRRPRNRILRFRSRWVALFPFSPLFTALRKRISGEAPARRPRPLFFFMNELRLEVPRLNPLPFIIADVVLLGVAALIGWLAPAPIGPGYLAAIAICVATGAVALLYPFVVNHARRQEEALQDRANQIEALARTVSASAEQISIAVSNLPAIAENSARQLKAAEQLPAALKEQLAGLQQQLSATANEENAALRHELDTLRSAETNKLASALDGLSRAAADLARLEKLAAQHSTALDQAIAQIPKVADSFGQQASEALRRETAAAVKALHAAAAEAGQALGAATAEARMAFDRGVRDAVAHLAVQAASTPPFPAHVANTPVVTTEAPAQPASPAPVPAPAREAVQPRPAPAVEPDFEIAATSSEAAEAVAATEAEASAPAALIDDTDLDEPDAVPARPSAEPAPAADAEAASPAPEPVVSEPEPAAEPEEPVAAASSESGSDAEPASAPAEPALSNDGYTRLIATAYIGIGNKLFIRGDGPGLRRDKGVPLQFVSIGKWRWESAELLFPVKARLYKNDQVECVALGEITLEPGHHHEVNATF